MSTVAELNELVALLEQEDVIALDTEFMSMPYYKPRLEVLQVATEKGVIAVVDCQTLTLYRLKALMQVIVTKTVILHSCKGDLEILYDLSKTLKVEPKLPAKIYDTQVAAALLGYGNMLGFGALVKEMFGVELDKSDTLTDWSSRPLTEKQIEYALHDVKLLHALRTHLNQELTDAGRREACDEELDALSHEAIYTPTTSDEVWRKVAGARKLDSHSVELSVMKEIARWREVQGKGGDICAGMLLRNETMYGIAVQQPTTSEALQRVMGIKPITLKLHGRAILQAVERGINTKEADMPCQRVDHRQGQRLKDGLFNMLNSLVQSKAAELSISPFYLAPRQELLDLSSVSTEALQRVSRVALDADHWKPALSPSNFFGFRQDVMPLELCTMPSSRYSMEFGQDPLAPYTLEEEMEMLFKLKTLTGWRRGLIGDDLLKVALGSTLTWNSQTHTVSQSGQSGGDGRWAAVVTDLMAMAENASKEEQQELLGGLRDVVAKIEGLGEK